MCPEPEASPRRGTGRIKARLAALATPVACVLLALAFAAGFAAAALRPLESEGRGVMTGGGTTSVAAAATATGSADGQSADRPPERSSVSCGAPIGRSVPVATNGDLAAALAAAQPGDLIRLADGTYEGRFVITASGEERAPVTLCGGRAAVIDAGTIDEGYALHLRADHWILRGFTVQNAEKGIVLDRASGNVLRDLFVRRIGHEAVHFRTFSRDNVLRDSEIRETGLEEPRFGEGVYIGSAESNWCSVTGCEPDASDDNQILDNVIGPDVTAEQVDVKEGTTSGLIEGNTFLGEGMTEVDAWVNVKGNGYLIAGNRGESSPRDGFRTSVVHPGWGNDNVFTGNVADVRGPGYGFRITGEGWQGNAVACDNEAINAEAGLANIPCDPAYDGIESLNRRRSAPRPIGSGGVDRRVEWDLQTGTNTAGAGSHRSPEQHDRVQQLVRRLLGRCHQQRNWTKSSVGWRRGRGPAGMA